MLDFSVEKGAVPPSASLRTDSHVPKEVGGE
jgi:hypothetical protein